MFNMQGWSSKTCVVADIETLTLQDIKAENESKQKSFKQGSKWHGALTHEITE